MTDGASTKRVHIVDCEWKEACEIEAHWASPLSADLGRTNPLTVKHDGLCDCIWPEEPHQNCLIGGLLAEVAALQAQVDALTEAADTHVRHFGEPPCSCGQTPHTGECAKWLAHELARVWLADGKKLVALRKQVDALTREREAVERVLARWEGPLPEPRTTMPSMLIDAGIRTGIEECAKELRTALAAASEQGETPS